MQYFITAISNFNILDERRIYFSGTLDDVQNQALCAVSAPLVDNELRISWKRCIVVLYLSGFIDSVHTPGPQ